MSNWDSKKYKVKEEYMGKEIIVDVNETWKNGNIDSAMISCPEYSSMIRCVGHRVGNYRPCKNGGVVGEIIKRLSVEDVHDAIFKEIYNAEKSICRNRNIEHDNFYVTRHFHVVTDYKDQEVPVTLMVKSGSNKVSIIYGHQAIHTSVDNFRNEIIMGLRSGMSAIDRGYVFPKPGIVSKVKKKIKNYINYGV